MKREKVDQFFQTFNRVAKQMLVPEDLIPSLEVDMELPLSDLNTDLIDQLNRLAPFGNENPQPLFCSSRVKVKSQSFVVGAKHIKFWITDGKLTCEAIGYNKASVFPKLSGGETADLVYSPSINTWQGNFSIQLKIEDLKVCTN
ncbi:MAG: hypothetical protein HQ595_01425 [Candidatus Omnitrophica bacterium]|nr:hypothetical protein [Candidatus Omnitrophota bacterium]